MSNMQTFYTYLVNIAPSSETKMPVTEICQLTAVNDEWYQQKLVRLTQATLAELIALKSVRGWKPWWQSSELQMQEQAFFPLCLGEAALMNGD